MIVIVLMVLIELIQLIATSGTGGEVARLSVFRGFVRKSHMLQEKLIDNELNVKINLKLIGMHKNKFDPF